VLSALKRAIVGEPLATAQARHERLSKSTGLAIFASDNLSSVAYASEEILRVLILAGAGALSLASPIGVAIAIVIAIVIYSYRQTILAYPQGASDYIVAKDNIGTLAGLTAGGALLIDYTLTVAVSVSAGVAAMTSAVPILFQHRVIEELVDLKPGREHPHNWMVEATEVPVALPNEAETRIDILLRNQATGGNPWYALLECKRSSKDYKRWVFFGKTQRGRGVYSRCYYIEHADLLGSWNHQGEAPMTHRVEVKHAPEEHEAFDYYLEVKTEPPGREKTVSATKAIEDAFQQVTLGQAGLALRMRKTNLLKFRLLPVVVTTAEVLTAAYEIDKVSLEHGRFAPEDLVLESRPWVAVNYRVNDVVCEFSRFSTNRQSDIASDVAARQVRTVFVVQAGRINEFLAWLWKNFECSQ